MRITSVAIPGVRLVDVATSDVETALVDGAMVRITCEPGDDAPRFRQRLRERGAVAVRVVRRRRSAPADASEVATSDPLEQLRVAIGEAAAAPEVKTRAIALSSEWMSG